MSFADTTIVVSTCDKYAAAWGAFAHGLQKYWPGHPRVLFVTNRQRAAYGDSFVVGADHGWATNLRRSLAEVHTPFVLYMQEDYWLKSPVDQAQLEAYLELFRTGKLDYLRVMNSVVPEQVSPLDERLGVIPPHAEYRTSLQAALWRKETLLELLVDGESGWDWEMKSVARSARYGDRFQCVRKRRFGLNYVSTAIVAGEWIPEARSYARAEGIEVPFGELPLPPLKKRLHTRLSAVASRARRALRRLASGVSRRAAL